MYRLSLNKGWLAFLLAAACVGGVLLYARIWPQPYSEAATIGKNVSSFQELSNRFTAIARAKGGLYAYEILRRADLPPDTDFHLLGHAIGDVMYTQLGVGGIADCTQEFRNACSHTMVIGALQDYGASAQALSLIDDACKKAPGGPGAYTMCYHGLGHGVFAYFGYDLAKTSDFCKKMGTPAYHDEQYTQCVGGAIMELMGGGGHDHDKWEIARQKYLTNDPLAPCTNPLLPEGAKGYCYIYLTPRLFELAGAALAHPDPSTFPKAFSFCDAIPKSHQQLRDSCFGGFGKEFIPLASARDIRHIDKMTDEEFKLAAGWCELSAADDGKRACIGQDLESVFWGGENDPAASFRFCPLAPQDLQDACYKKLASNIHQYLSGDTRVTWCQKLSAAYQPVCMKEATLLGVER